MKTDVRALVVGALDVVLKQQNMPSVSEMGEDTPLFTSLDSLAVLDVVLELEDSLQRAESRYIQIADENTFDSGKTPFQSVRTLIHFVMEKVKGENCG